MNAISIIDEHRNTYCEIPSIMVSGADGMVKQVIFQKWFDMAYETGAPHIVIDLSKMGELKNVMNQYGVRIGAYIPGNNCFSVFDGDDIDSEDRLRVWMGNAGWSEEKKDKAISYLLFLMHMNELETGTQGKLGMELCVKYSAPKEFENRVQQLVNQGILGHYEQINILGKYSELSSAAPDLENLLTGGSITEGMTNEREIEFENLRGNNALYVHLGKVRDEYTRKNILNAVKGKIDNYMYQQNMVRPVITIYSKGKLSDNVISEFVNDLEEIGQILLVTDNIFGINDSGELQQNFSMRIYSRHTVMDAAEKVQDAFGYIYVRKKSYAVAQDMHQRSRGIIDRILKTDVVRTETISEPRPEAKYRKEDIVAFPPGYCIVSYSGQDMIMQLMA